MLVDDVTGMYKFSYHVVSDDRRWQEKCRNKPGSATVGQDGTNTTGRDGVKDEPGQELLDSEVPEIIVG